MSSETVQMVSPAKRVHFQLRPHHLTYQPWARPSAIKVAILTEKQDRLAKLSRSVSPKVYPSTSIMKTTSRGSVLSHAVQTEKELPVKKSAKNGDLPPPTADKSKRSSTKTPTNPIDFEKTDLEKQQEDLIKKVAAFKPLINSASANVNLNKEKDDDNRKSSDNKSNSAKDLKEKVRDERVEKNERVERNERPEKMEKGERIEKSDKNDKKKTKSHSTVEYPDTSAIIDKTINTRSSAPSKNALNFNALQQQPANKSPTSKSPTRRIP
ncbi:unnamed protein product [Bursaphelenchus okinawaensis]|uniref:Uncharacterized protein n=1 Tax=Bursaphelenchus okinawaensis TaxID=465554 RepID=A0A811LC73_9BILA|nr:unnamed protein product [Bursaphelenchus okinawaensis]CAG9121263.1 unnamed protein product [Bursaphelenchus okinawaensis]